MAAAVFAGTIARRARDGGGVARATGWSSSWSNPQRSRLAVVSRLDRQPRGERSHHEVAVVSCATARDDVSSAGQSERPIRRDHVVTNITRNGRRLRFADVRSAARRDRRPVFVAHNAVRLALLSTESSATRRALVNVAPCACESSCRGCGAGISTRSPALRHRDHGAAPRGRRRARDRARVPAHARRGARPRTCDTLGDLDCSRALHAGRKPKRRRSATCRSRSRDEAIA